MADFPPFEEVPVQEGLSIEAFRSRFVRRRRPVVLRGAAAAWPALERWTPERLMDEAGDVVVQAQIWTLPLSEETRRYESMPLRACFDRMRSPSPTERVYLAHCDTSLLPALARDFWKLPHVPTRGALPSQLWIGTAGTFTPLHYDTPHNLIVQIAGRKRVVLVDRRDAGLFDAPSPLDARQYPDPIVDIETPERSQLRWLARARPRSCTVGAGDALFIPSRWRHQVRSLDEAVSLNFFWVTPALWPLRILERILAPR